MFPESLYGIWSAESPLELHVSASKPFNLVSAQTFEDSQEPVDGLLITCNTKVKNDGCG